MFLINKCNFLNIFLFSFRSSLIRSGYNLIDDQVLVNFEETSERDDASSVHSDGDVLSKHSDDPDNSPETHNLSAADWVEEDWDAECD